MNENLKLENQLCFPLYALSRQITTLYRPYLDKFGITYPQFLVLLILWEHSSATVKQLGEYLLLDSGTLTPLLKRMEAGGLITRTRSAEDERVVRISITDKGKLLEKEAEKIPSLMKQQLGMDDHQLAEMREQINKILAIACHKKKLEKF